MSNEVKNQEFEQVVFNIDDMESAGSMPFYGYTFFAYKVLDYPIASEQHQGMYFTVDGFDKHPCELEKNDEFTIDKSTHASSGELGDLGVPIMVLSIFKPVDSIPIVEEGTYFVIPDVIEYFHASQILHIPKLPPKKDDYLLKLFINEAKPALERHSGGSGGGSAPSGEMTGIGADVYVVMEGRLYTFAELLCMAQGLSLDYAIRLESSLRVIVINELLDFGTVSSDFIVLGIVNNDLYAYDSLQWNSFSDAMGMPYHGWIEKSALETMDYTNENNVGAYAVQRISDPIIEDTLTDLVSNAKYINMGSPPTLLTTASLPEAITIGKEAFHGAPLSSVSMPKVVYIGDSAFLFCDQLTSIIFPASLKIIDAEAFRSCSSLTNITFLGTVEQWNAIYFGEKWNFQVPATEVICSDGTVPLS